MTIYIFIVVNFAAALFFTKYQKKNIQALEIFAYWVIFTILIQNYSALFFMNLKFAAIPNVFSLEMANFINRTVLYPILGIMFLNHYVVLTSAAKKLGLILGYWLLLNGIEWVEDRLGVYIHSNWKAWWSLSFWLAYLLISIGFMKFFRKKLKKGRQRT